MSKLTLATEGDTHVIVTRKFSASPDMVYRAHTDPKIVQKWLLGPPGWTMPVCINEAKPGGKIRYEWSNGKGGFYLTGEYISLTPGKKTVHVERMFMPDQTPDNHVETQFDSDGAGGTVMTMRMTVPNKETRAAMLASGMDKGMEASYARLEEMVGAGAIA